MEQAASLILLKVFFNPTIFLHDARLGSDKLDLNNSIHLFFEEGKVKKFYQQAHRLSLEGVGIHHKQKVADKVS